MPFDAGAPCKADLQEVLASFIGKLPKEEFDMSAVMNDRHDVETGKRCGSVGCIAGWASTIPQLIEAGVPKYGSGEYHFFRSRALLTGSRMLLEWTGKSFSACASLHRLSLRKRRRDGSGLWNKLTLAECSIRIALERWPRSWPHAVSVRVPDARAREYHFRDPLYRRG